MQKTEKIGLSSGRHHHYRNSIRRLFAACLVSHAETSVSVGVCNQPRAMAIIGL